MGKKIGGGTRPPWPTSINLTDESHIFVQLPAQVKCQQGNNIKTKEVMLKIMSPGKVERAQSRAKGVYSGGDTARARGAPRTTRSATTTTKKIGDVFKIKDITPVSTCRFPQETSATDVELQALFSTTRKGT